MAQVPQLKNIKGYYIFLSVLLFVTLALQLYVILGSAYHAHQSPPSSQAPQQARRTTPPRSTQQKDPLAFWAALKTPSHLTPSKMSHTAFFYGTLMAPQVLHRVIWGNTDPPAAQKELLHIRPAILHRFRRHKVRFADYPAIVPANSTGSVRGTLVTGLTDGDLWRLDIFEGDEYERIKVKVRVLEQKEGEEGMGDVEAKEEDNVEGEEVEAEVYAWMAGKQRLESEEWDFGEFVREKLHRWAGREAQEVDSGFQGRQSIIDVDDAVAAAAAQGDPTGGRGANGKIGRTLEENRKVDEVVKAAV